MATWFWAAAAAANFATANWATSHGGSPSGQPTTGDTAIFDSTSSQTCTVAASVSLASLDCQGGTGNFAGTLVQNNSVIITITGTGAGALRLSSGMTYSPATATAIITFANTSGVANLTSAGKAFAGITMNGVGGTCQQQDNLAINSIANATLTLTAGTWDCNNTGGYTLTACIVSITGSTARVFIGAGTITISGNVSAGQIVWNANVLTNLTFTKNSANIVVLAPITAVAGILVMFGTLTYNTISFATTTTNVTASLTGVATFGALNVAPGWTIIVSAGITLTVNTAFTWVGTPTQPIGFGQAIGGSGQVTMVLSCPSGACTLQWGVLFGQTAQGGATFAATDTLVLGPLSGWSASQPVDAVLSPAGLATAVWQDLLSSSDFSTSGSIGALLKAISNLQFTVPAIGRGTCTTGGSTTSVVTSAFAPSGAVANQFAGRVILFDAATTTAALRGQVGTISASSNSATPTFTVSALTTAPASGDTFSVL